MASCDTEYIRIESNSGSSDNEISQFLKISAELPDGQRMAAIERTARFMDCLPHPEATQNLVESGMPQQIRPYRLLSRIGQGGMGTVFKAWNPILGQPAAIKVMSRFDPQLSRRFAQEIQLLARLKHDNIVSARSAGDDQELTYFVMEFLDGLDLSAVARRMPRLSVPDVCEILRQLLQGVAYAHEHGLVHRDIKPGNIMLSRDGVVRLLDLGLARECTPSGDRVDFTKQGQFVGTPDYAAPEQLLGEPAET